MHGHKTNNDDDDDKDIRLDWLTVMFDDFLHQLVSGSSALEAMGEV